MGRIDDQVKIRGHRVEPSEVEAALTALPGIGNAAVVACMDAGGFAQLVAHVVAPGLTTATVRAELARRLPGYMIPASFVFHDALPLSPNRKLDRKQLPVPKHQAPGEIEPRTETERRVASIWKVVLGLDAIDKAADFFVLGGQSLLAIRLLVAIEAEFGCRISVRSLYQSPTIESLSAIVEAREVTGKMTLMRNVVPPVKRSGAAPNVRDSTKLRLVRRARGISRGSVLGMPGFIGHAAKISIIAANALEDYDVWTFAVETNGRKLMEGEAWLTCAREIADRLMAKDDLRPCAIMGFSLGGFMAWLVERFLVAAGGDAIPIINFDGGAAHLDNKDRQARIVSLLPAIGSREPPKMLLMQRQLPGKFLFKRPDSQWVNAGVSLEKLSYCTLAHDDVASPAAIVAVRQALAAFVETGRVDSIQHPSALSFDTIGGIVFRLLDDISPPDAAAVRVFVAGRTLPKDHTLRLALLILAAATGDAEMALLLARRMTIEEPRHRAATYAQVALLSELERAEEASTLAKAWCSNHPLDRNMQARVNQARQQPAPWGSVEGLVVGSDASLNFAIQVGLFQNLNASLSPGR
jgi:acyl carrier protein